MTIEFNNKTYEVKVTRRRYGRTFFTWIDYFKSQDGVCYGSSNDMMEPFPCAMPKKSELIELLKEWMETGKKWIYVKKGEGRLLEMVYI